MLLKVWLYVQNASTTHIVLLRRAMWMQRRKKSMTIIQLYYRDSCDFRCLCISMMMIIDEKQENRNDDHSWVKLWLNPTQFQIHPSMISLFCEETTTRIKKRKEKIFILSSLKNILDFSFLRLDWGLLASRNLLIFFSLHFFLSWEMACVRIWEREREQKNSQVRAG